LSKYHTDILVIPLIRIPLTPSIYFLIWVIKSFVAWFYLASSFTSFFWNLWLSFRLMARVEGTVGEIHRLLFHIPASSMRQR